MTAKTQLSLGRLPRESGDSPVRTGLISVLVLFTLTSVTNAAANTPTSSLASAASPLSTSTATALIPPGTDCADTEALFNCLTTEWQQCASGQWSIAIEGQGDDGLVCSPSGLSYDMKIVYANGTAAGPGDSDPGEVDSITGTSGGSGENAQGTATATATATTPGSSIAGGGLENAGASAIASGWWKGSSWRWLSASLVASALVYI